jgi:hypothetical protein
MSDIYATPGADLSQDISDDRIGGNIDDAISGNFQVNMLETLGEAWRQLKGFKLKCHIALALYFLVIFGIAMVVGFGVAALAMSGVDPNAIMIINIAVQLVITMVALPMSIAVMIMGIRHAQGKSVSAGEVFRHFGTMGTLLLAYIVMTILILIGLALFVIPGLYLMYAYMFAMPLIVEKKMGAWHALETSRKAVTKVWFRFFGFVWLLMLINVVAAIPLGLGWIWTVPWSVLAFAMVYIKMFGAEVHTLAD